MKSKIADAFYRHATLTPDKEAIICDGKAMTYGELADFVSRLSHLLLSCGATYGDHIAIPMNNSIESVALFVSAADLGLCLVPLNASMPYEAVKAAMQAADAKHLIARSSFLRDCARYGHRVTEGFTLCLDTDFEGAVPFSRIDEMPATRPDGPEVDGGETYILTLTSGSTGSPKPIDLSQDNKLNRIMAHQRVYAISEADRILAATPLYHSLAERLVLMPLVLGATCVLLPRFTPQLWIDCARSLKATFTIAVSAQLAQILDVVKQWQIPPIASFRAIVSSSALLEQDVKLELTRLLPCEFHEMYGTSETSTATSICFQQEPSKRDSVGRAFDGAAIAILDDEGRECAPYTVGEIAVASPLRCKGYYKLPALMDEATTRGFFRTGDLGSVDADGYLYFAGRKKELIITGAVNVYPADIDTVVARMEGIAECAAFSFPDHRLGEVVALAVVTKPGTVFQKRRIQTYCARHLADFQQPHKIFRVDALPRNAMGKLRRNDILPLVREAAID